MPKSQRSPRNTQPNTSKPQLFLQNFQPSPPEFSTLALNADWRPCYDWATKNGVLADLFLLANATLLRDEYISIGRLLEVISSPSAFKTTYEWSQAEDSALPIFRLAQATLSDPTILENYPALSTSKAASKQFAGKLEKNYLIALIIEKLPELDVGDPKWLETLKLWALTHAVHRARNQSYQDDYLRQVSDKLRLACRAEGDWRNLFLLLKACTLDFDELSRSVAFKSEKLLNQKRSPVLSSDVRVLLRALINVANRRFSEASTSNTPPNIIPFHHVREKSTATRTNFPEEGKQEIAPGLPDGQWVPSEDESSSGVLIYKNDTNKSLTQQRQLGNSIILYCTEELQHLPFSWGKPNPQELMRINQWLHKSLSSSKPQLLMLAAIVYLSINLGRSLRRTLDIRITNEINGEWTLNPESFQISRLTPRREPGWKPKDSIHLDWISPTIEAQTLQLPREVKKALRNGVANLSIGNCISSLWNNNWSETIESVYAEEFETVSRRVTGGMLANVLSQRLFEQTADRTFTSLFASHPRTALSGATAYSSWIESDLSKVIGETYISTSKSSNAMGSMLDAIESQIKESIKRGTAKQKKLGKGNSIVEFHNGYTAYLTVALLAATGARPVRDLIENIRQIDFQERFIYINDKNSNELRQGRLVPLPETLCAHIEQAYIDHLNNLARVLEPTNPELSQSIYDLIAGKKPGVMPFLFLLEDDIHTWKSVGEKEISNLGLFDWPLPLNHFRHRLPNQLRRRGVDPEVIDSIMGHAESGSATHGDFSFRIWEQDMREVRHALESTYEHLGFESIPAWSGSHQITISNFPSGKSSKPPKLFGSAEREKARREKHRASIKDARIQIEQTANGRSLSALSEQEINELSCSLLFYRSGMPHPSGPLKYQVLLRRIERECKKTGKKIRLSRRYQTLDGERSPFNSHAPCSLQSLHEMRSITESISAHGLSRVSSGEIANISAVLCCVEGRITDIKILTDIHQSKNFRLITSNHQAFLEHSEGLVHRLSKNPVRRFQVGKQTAMFLDELLSRKRFRESNDIPTSLIELTKFIPSPQWDGGEKSFGSLIRGICLLADQVNVMTLPGIFAGYLSGRVESYSLGWSDWIRLKCGYSIQLPTENTADRESPLEVNVGKPISMVKAIPQEQDIGIQLLQESAFSFIKKIEGIINSEEYVDKGYALNNRKIACRKILDVVAEHTGKVSTSLLLLGNWTAAILFRKHRGKYNQFSSANRYLGALKTGFSDAGYDFDILAADDDEITDFYCDIFETISVKDTKYVANRLSEFHRWARENYAIQNPDWSLLPASSETLRVSPGAINEEDYRCALRLLLNAPSIDPSFKLLSACLLILSYRFGLRSNEALGLSREDIQIHDEGIIILVQNNRYRKLKTDTSRRQVPLVFNLIDLEVDCLNQWITKHEAECGSNIAAPAFVDLRNVSGISMGRRIKRLVIEALKTASGNTLIGLHHARHSAANIITLALTQVYMPHNGAMPYSFGSPVQAETNQILLGRTGKTRRTMWAASRFLGHGRRKTTCRNYLHFIGDLTSSFIPHLDIDANTMLINAVNLDECPRLAKIDSSLLSLQADVFPNPQPADLLKLMRMISRGSNPNDAAHFLRISKKYLEMLVNVLKSAGSKMRFGASNANKSFTDKEILSLVQRIKEPAWNRIISGISDLKRQSQMPPCAFSAESLVEMIGPSRQIVIWKEEQVSLLSRLVSFLELQKSDYQIVVTTIGSDQLISTIVNHNLLHIPLKEVTMKKRFQIDGVQIENGKYSVQGRGAFVISENDSRLIRNNLESIIIFIAYSIFLSTPTN